MKLNSNTTTNDTAVRLDNLKGKDGVFVSVDFSSFSGKKSEKTSRVLSEEGSDVSEVTDKPRKFLVNTKHLSFVQKYYQRAKRMLDRAGIPVWGGWLVPADEFEMVKERFEILVEQYDQEARAFVASYERLLDQQCKENPSISVFIRKDAPTVADVESRFFMRMSPPMSIVIGGITDAEREGNENLLNKKLIIEFQSLSEQVLRKIGSGDVVGQKAIGFLSEMEAKAAKFSFLDPIWAGLAGTINNLRLSFPKSGALDTKSTVILKLLLTSLANEQSLAAQLGSFEELGLDGAAEAELDLYLPQDTETEEVEAKADVQAEVLTVEIDSDLATLIDELRNEETMDDALAQLRKKFSSANSAKHTAQASVELETTAAPSKSDSEPQEEPQVEVTSKPAEEVTTQPQEVVTVEPQQLANVGDAIDIEKAFSAFYL